VAAGLALWRPWERSVGANGDIRVGFIGLRNKGGDHLRDFREIRGVRVAALCDVDEEILAGEKKKCADEGDRDVAVYGDFRKLLEDKNVDAVVIATPNHWHAMMGVMAMEAGKDVYVEKPVSHTIWEGRQLVKAAQRTGRIVQAGTQFRSEEGIAKAIAWQKEGHIGKMTHIRSVSYKLREKISRRKSPLPTAKTVNYDLWCGPAEKLEIYRGRLHYDWHWFWNTGDGDLGNMGIHDLDVARWFAGHSTAAPEVMSVGGRFAFGDDGGETPNTQLTLYNYPIVPIIHEVRGLPMKVGGQAMNHYKSLRTGNVVHCEGGYIAQNIAYDNDGKKLEKFSNYGGGGHQRNWLEAISARDASKLAAPIEGGHISTTLCHQGNISYRLGKAGGVEFGNAAADEALDLMREHVLKHDSAFTTLNAGPLLEFDSASESFSDAGANKLLTRKYRAGYEFPVS
jgi:predicted dehydrogenase